ncbi:hypothetical protein NPIL_236171 [Nephila pilipes]|uniref:Secreted protein n=1 Tax=Nephila pilipes TaxID=299642 RepID=A0A8X6NA33_NEPPI|nr:hypothetical protein NPIL_236171 [Nephila pilipes]
MPLFILKEILCLSVLAALRHITFLPLLQANLETASLPEENLNTAPKNCPRAKLNRFVDEWALLGSALSFGHVVRKVVGGGC